MKYLLDTNIISEFVSKKPNQPDLGHQSKKIKILLDWLNNDLMQRFEGRIVDIDRQTMLKWGEIN